MATIMSGIGRRDFLTRCLSGTAGVTLAAVSGIGCMPQQAGRKPNIIYIMADDLGYGDVGCYGQQQIRTPNIDALASEGLKFTAHYAGSTVCAPSRCCLMTGVHTGHAQVRGNKEVNPMGQWPLEAGTMTVARMLQQAGYATGLIGKWGLGVTGSDGHPNKQGFDYFFGYLCQRHAHNYFPEYLFRNEEKVPLRNKVMDPRKEPREDGAGVATERVDYSADFFADEALQFVESHKDVPFFLYLALTLPHANNEAGNDGLETPSQGPYVGKDWPKQEKDFAAMVGRLDDTVGSVMARLKTLGIDDNTIVFFTSDNGPHREGGQDPDFFDSNGPYKGTKRDLYEGGIRVPFIARWPQKIQAGAVTDHVAAFWDFLPTAAAIAGIPAPEGIDGISYLPALTGGDQREHEFLYWEFHEGRGSKQAVRVGQWKAVHNRMSEPLELYDLNNDPGEDNNIAAQHSDIVQKIEEYLKTARTTNQIWELFES